jgi:hypothetical protein
MPLPLHAQRPRPLHPERVGVEGGSPVVGAETVVGLTACHAGRGADPPPSHSAAHRMTTMTTGRARKASRPVTSFDVTSPAGRHMRVNGPAYSRSAGLSAPPAGVQHESNRRVRACLVRRWARANPWAERNGPMPATFRPGQRGTNATSRCRSANESSSSPNWCQVPSPRPAAAWPATSTAASGTGSRPFRRGQGALG